MKREFQRVFLIAIPLIGLLLILGACASTSATQAAPTAKPVVFITSDLTIMPEAISIGDSSTIGVTVTNTGEQPGTYTVALKVNDAIAETKDVTLDGEASQMVTFIFNPSNMRDYMVAIDQLKGVLRVSCEVPET